jgi:hypothetical protein
MVKRNVNMVFSNPSKKARHNSTTTSSPFEQPSGFSIYLEPVLNPYWKTYSEILTLSNMPPGSLREMVMLVDFPRLSPFRPNSGPFFNGQSCVPCIMRYPASAIGSAFRNEESFLRADDISSLFSYLIDNGYQIQDRLTNMMFEGNIPTGNMRASGNRKLVAIVRYVNS